MILAFTGPMESTIFSAHFFKGFENSQCSGFFFRSYRVSIVIIFEFNFKSSLNCQIAISFSAEMLMLRCRLTSISLISLLLIKLSMILANSAAGNCAVQRIRLLYASKSIGQPFRLTLELYRLL